MDWGLILYLMVMYMIFGLDLSMYIYQPSVEDLFDKFKDDFYKEYINDTEEEAFNIFEINLKSMREHNIKTKASFSMGINYFSDMSWTQIQSRYLCQNIHLSGSFHENSEIFDSDDYPTYKKVFGFDWREKMTFEEPLFQGECASGWAFASLGALEFQIWNDTGKTIRLSEQHLIDCTRPFNSHGCNCGDLRDAFSYMNESKRIALQESYQNTQNNESFCRDLNHYRSIVVDVDYKRYMIDSITDMKRLLIHYGPIPVLIEVDENFMRYSDGIYKCYTCGGDLTVNHAVLLVGFGTMQTQKRNFTYWIAKNSFGPDWGIDGYFHVVASEGNTNIELSGNIVLKVKSINFSESTE